MSYSGHFLFSSFFSVPPHISRPKGCISHFPHFQLSCHILGSTVRIYQFSGFLIFLVIFHYLISVILIFHDFQFSCHIPFPTEDISHFQAFSVFLAICHVLQHVCLIFHIFSYLAIFQVLQCEFINFLVF